MKMILRLSILLFFVINSIQAQTVDLSVDGPSGNLYVNDIYTGKQSPAIINIPAGQVRIGIGNSSGYYQKTVNSSATNNADLNGLHPLPRRVYKMVILPVRWTSHGGEMAKLEDSDLELVRVTTRRASQEEVLIGTYGMVEWKIDEVPIVENIMLQRGAANDQVPDGGKLVEEAGLTNLYDEYDVIFLYYSVRREGGAYVQNGPCCIWGGWNMMFLDNGPRDDFNRNKNKYFGFGYTHEWLHGVEQRSGIYVEGGLHGAAAHNYAENAKGMTDWSGWYQDFMWGVVPKASGSQEKTDYVGQFFFLKNWQRDPGKDSEPIINVGMADGTYYIKSVQSGRYLSVLNAELENGGGVVQSDFSGGQHQQWNLRKVGEGMYSLTAVHSGKSLDVDDNGTFNGDNILQWDYWGGRNQKWYLIPVGNNQFKIISHHSGRSVDVLGVSMANNADVVQWDYLGGNNQKWIFESASITALDNKYQQNVKVGIYPNPADKMLYIHSEEDLIRNISIINMEGQEVLSVSGEVSDVDISGLSSGLYAVLLNGTCTLKFVKK